MTSNPQNTPYGAYLAAEAKLNIRLQNEAGQELEIASWGDGFLSKRVCEAIEGIPGGQSTNCTITTPGQVISEALTFQLSTGQQTLIAADEINEIIGALMSQLALQAVKGINGLLGLGGNSTYTATDSAGRSYLDAAVAEEPTTDTSALRNQMRTALQTERSYLALINSTVARASSTLISRGLSPTGAVISTSTDPNASPESASSSVLLGLIVEALTTKLDVDRNISELTTLIVTYDTASTSAAANSTRSANTIRNQAILNYLNLAAGETLTPPATVATKRIEWARLLPPPAN